jgi:hypothetical protein
MTMKAYVVVRGTTDVAILRAVLPPDLLDEVDTTPAGERSNLASVARTLLVTRRKPVAVLVNSDSTEEGIVQERFQLTQELVKAAAAGLPVRVILLVPHIEVIFFQAKGVLTRIYGDPLPQEVCLLARYSPREALERLFAQASGPDSLHALLDCLDDRAIAAIQATPPLRELIAFLRDVIIPRQAS